MLEIIEIEKIHPNPLNPRKDVGNVDELADSIAKNGVMQNLTVIKGSYKGNEFTDEDYTLLIGHRRHKAAIQAGIKNLPCKIVETMEEREQVGIMLEENMQRSDLSIYEQGQGFQIMLDLGETKESISKKTGFSRTTIDHRLNIAKLNQKIVKEKTESEGFQLTLQDFYELEKIKKISERNKILKEAKDSTQVRGMVSKYIIEEKKEKEKARLVEQLESIGVKPIPEKERYNLYSQKWEVVKRYDLEKENVIKLPKEELFYYLSYGTIDIYKEVKKIKKEKTPEQIEKEEEDRKIKRIEQLDKSYIKTMKKFVISNLKDVLDANMNMIAIYALDAGVSLSEINLITTRKQCPTNNYYLLTQEEKKEERSSLRKLSIAQILALACAQTDETHVSGRGYFKKIEYRKNIYNLYMIAELLGYRKSEEERQITEGTHELYIKSYTKGDEY